MESVMLKDVIVPDDRGRKSFTRIMEMAESIKKFGIIHPIVLAPAPDKPDKFVLVAGERRYRGALLAGLVELPYTLREDSAEILAEIELEENVCRADISFEEEGNILAKIQTLKKKSDPKWGVAQTAELTGRSMGDVSGKIKIARIFKERPDLKEKCKTLPYTAALKKIAMVEESEKVQRLVDQGQITLSTDLLLGDCRELIMNLKPESVDLLLTDPPYAGLTGGYSIVPGGVGKHYTETITLGADEWNSIFENDLPTVSKVTQKRKSAINGCIAEMKGTDHDFSKIELWTKLFNHAKLSNFLMGGSKDGWTMNFDFIITKSKLLKIVEGQYDN